MSNLYLQTPSCVVNLPELTREAIARQVTSLLITEPWVRLAGVWQGTLGVWTVMARDNEGAPDLITFERHDGLTELFNPNVEM